MNSVFSSVVSNRLQAPSQLIAATVACAFGLAAGDLAAATRHSARSALARQTAMYLTHVVFGVTCSAVGRAFGRDPSTVRHACALIETARDKAPFDRLLSHLECASRTFAASLKVEA